VATTSEGFSTSGNAVVTSQEHAARTKVTYNLLEDMNGLAAFSQLCKGQLTCIHLPSTTMGSRRLSKNGKQTHRAVKEASKAFYGYLRAGVSGK